MSRGMRFEEWVPPSSTAEPDPFNPDVSIWPPPPPWLFPTTMTLLGIAAAVVIVLVIMWVRASAISRNEAAARAPKEWIDISDLGSKGRWNDKDES